MPIERWKAIKGAFFAVLTVAFAAFVIRMEADPTAVFFGAATLLLVYFGVELKEVELARGVTITFLDGEERDDDGGE
ncbi:hypothetical protein [Salinilacihabitans rarus]|uniref:hypothetical protein n=1 Tax=Salinilacihabitans rarus TaxID=2961596 RepID=UPI0020C9257E|nr:hypothetical protein [Salinilacihabitans rarus]